MSMKRCNELLAECFQTINKNIDSGVYMHIGGYNMYKTDREQAVKEYKEAASNIIMAEETLSLFLEARKYEEISIINADKALDEKEKELAKKEEECMRQEERVKAAESENGRLKAEFLRKEEEHSEMKNKYEEDVDKCAKEGNEEYDLAVEKLESEHEHMVLQGEVKQAGQIAATMGFPEDQRKYKSYLITGIDNILHHTERGLGAVFGLGILDKVRQSEIEAQRVKVDKSEMEAQRVKVACKVLEGIVKSKELNECSQREKQLENELEVLRKENSEKEVLKEVLKQLQGLSNEMTLNLNTLNKDKKDFEDKISTLESTVEQEQQKTTSLKSQLDDSKRTAKELHSTLALAKKDSEDQKRRLGEIQLRENQLESQVQNMKKEYSEKEHEGIKSKKAMQDKISQVESSLQLKKDKEMIMKSEIQSLSENETKLQHEVEKVRQALGERNVQIDKLKEEKEILREKLFNEEQNKSVQSKELNESSEREKQFENNLEILRKKNTEQEQQLQSLSSEMKLKLNTFNKDRKDLEDKISTLESTVEQEQQKTTSLKSQLDDSKRTEKELHSTLTLAKKDIEDQKRRLGEIQHRENQLESQVQNMKKQNSDKEHEVIKSEKAMQEKISQERIMKWEIQSLSEKETKLQHEVEKVREALGERNVQIVILQEEKEVLVEKLFNEQQNKPAKLTDVEITEVKCNTAKLNWSLADGKLDNYEIKIDGKPYTKTEKPELELLELIPGTRYDVSVTPMIGRKCGKPKSIAVHTKLQMSELKSSDITCVSAKIEWEAAVGATSYDIVVNGKFIINTQKSEYQLTDAIPNTKYKVEVAPKNDKGTGESKSITVSTLQMKMTTITKKESCTSTHIHWDAAHGATSYDITITSSNHGKPKKQTENTESNAFTFMELKPDTQYEVTVTPKNEVYVGKPKKMKIQTLPLKMLNITQTLVTCTSAKLEWEAVEDAMTYEIRRNDCDAVETTEQKTHEIDNLNPGSAYSINIIPKANGTQGKPKYITIYTRIQMSELKSSDKTCVSAKIEWKAADGATSYDVVVNGKFIINKGETEIQLTGLSPDSEYTVEVTPKNDRGPGESKSITVSTLKMKMTTIRKKGFCTSIHVDWDAAHGAISYDITITSSNQGKPIKPTENTENKEFTFLELKPDTLYEITVTPKHDVSVGQPKTMQIKTLPLNLLNITETLVTCTSVKLDWEAVEGAMTYEIRRNDCDAVETTDQNTHELNNLNPGSAYSINIIPKANGTQGKPKYITIYTRIQMSELKSSDITCDSAKIEWEAAVGATSYDIVVTGTAVTGKTIISALKSEYQLTDAIPNTKYDVEVTPKNDKGTGESKSITVSTLESNREYANIADNKLNKKQTHYLWNEIGPSVCRIVVPGSTGTGFVVGSVQHKDTKQEHFFILTCHHVKIQDAMHPCYAEFGYTNRGQSPMFQVKILPTSVACDVNLDYNLVALDYEPQLFGYLKEKMANLIPKDQRPVEKEPLIIIGHPDGNELQLDPAVYCVPRPNNTPQPHEYIFYQCHSFHGASGAPVMSKDKQILYAMHCGGHGSEVEYGVALSEVLKDIKIKADSDLKLYVAKTLFPKLYDDEEEMIQD